MTMWLACHGRLATRQRLFRFGMVSDNRCCLCKSDEESINHLLFVCPDTVCIWAKILAWIQVSHTPQSWDAEILWLSKNTNGKGWRASILKLAAAETIYSVWKYRNDICFGNAVDKAKIVDNIIDIIVYRGWYSKNLRPHIAKLMAF
ncbi:uncharacterized protein LOC131613364 [Vicia villosa]|uniref:uncharacterized protein LOC131613364 n=1 Tax=Vicia villosa TaxID=3911 RepID=UPI00273B25E6|nr:uncharacterized protein LOC131613364 [Vicia villosa]